MNIEARNRPSVHRRRAGWFAVHAGNRRLERVTHRGRIEIAEGHQALQIIRRVRAGERVERSERAFRALAIVSRARGQAALPGGMNALALPIVNGGRGNAAK